MLINAARKEVSWHVVLSNHLKRETLQKLSLEAAEMIPRQAHTDV